MTRKERIRRAGELRAEFEQLMLSLRKDLPTWRSAWRARERWMKRWDEEVEAWYLDLHDRIDIEELARWTAKQWSVPIGLSRRETRVQKATAPDPSVVSERIGTYLAAEQWSAESVAAYIQLALRTGEDAGQFSLDALGLNRTFAWAHPRSMGRDLFAVRGSKIIQGTYGQHVDKLAEIIIRATDPAAPRAIGTVVREVRDEWSDLARWQAERIARTETAAVWENTHLNTMRANNVQRFEVLVASGPSIGVSSAAVDEICTSIAGSSPYEAGNVEPPPFHPNCRCTLLPVLTNADGSPWLPPQDPFTGETLSGWDFIDEGG